VQLRERLLRLVDDRLVALGAAELDQTDGVLELALELGDALDAGFQPGALAQQLGGFGRVVPELGILGPGVQLGEPLLRLVPVKDASSAAPGTAGSRRPGPAFQRA